MKQMRYSRRECLRVAAKGGFAGTAIAATAVASSEPTPADEVRVAGYAYDRVRAIQDGTLGLDGLDVRFQPENIYSLNRQVFGPERTYEVSETGLIPFIMRYANENFRAYTLIPVFISRTFRHRNIYVRTDRGIDQPGDLRGKKVGTPGYAMSSHTWIRGFLQDIYDVRPQDMHWIETTASSDGGKVSSGYEAFFLPDDFPITKGPPGIDESELILRGDVDALVTAIEPKAYADEHPKIRTLFPNVQATEKEYFRKTGVFPIMHAIAVRRDFADAHPELPAKLFALYSDAKQAAYKALGTVGALMVSLPWVRQELEATRELMGENYWRYGVEANRTELDLVVRYTHEQGLVKRKLSVEELFHPSTLQLTES